MKLLRIIFLAGLIISLVAYGFLFLASHSETTGIAVPVQTESISWVPILTAIGSLVGVAITSIISLRKDRLESRKLELEMKKLQLEIDQLKKKPDEK